MSQLKPVLYFCFGVILCLLTAEMMLRPVFRAKRTVCDDVDCYEPGSESRQCIEGFSVCHWLQHGVRGNGIVTNSLRPVMVMGDSFVEAVQVDDDELLSKRLEANLWAHNLPNLVFSLGISGAATADYVSCAAKYREWFDPAWTVVVLKSEDCYEAMQFNRKACFEVGKDGDALELRENTPVRTFEKYSFGKIYYSLLNESSLFQLSWVRAHECIRWWGREPRLFSASVEPSANNKPSAELPPIEAQLRELKRAFKGRLTVLYCSPGASPRNPAVKNALDLLVEESARKQNISFVSLCGAYNTALLRHEMPNGFANTQPFTGHWNRYGHKLAADAVTPELLRIHKKYGIF